MKLGTEKLNKSFIVLLIIVLNFLFITKTSAESIIKTISFDQGINHILVNPLDNKIYLLPFVFENDENKHLVLDGETNEIVDSFRVKYPGGTPALNPNTNKLYLTDYKTLNVIDLNTKTTIASIEFDHKVSGVHLNPKTNKIYVNLFGDDYNIQFHYLNHKGIAVVDGYTNQIIKTILPEDPNEIRYGSPLVEFGNVSNLIYIAPFDTNVLHIFDSATDTLLHTVNFPFAYTGENIKYLKFNEKEQKLYMATTKGRLLSWDAGGEKYSSEITLQALNVNECLSGLALNPDTNKLYVIGERELIIANCSNGEILQRLEMPLGALLKVNPATKTIYAGGLTDDREHLISVVKDDGVYGTTPHTDPISLPNEPSSEGEVNDSSSSGSSIKPFWGGIGVKNNGGTKESLHEETRSLLYELIDSMKYVGSEGGTSRRSSRKVVRSARMLLRIINAQNESCQEGVSYFLNKIDNEISRLSRLNHIGINDELYNLLQKDNNQNKVVDVCESSN